jgi:hypothetical protein
MFRDLKKINIFSICPLYYFSESNKKGDVGICRKSFGSLMPDMLIAAAGTIAGDISCQRLLYSNRRYNYYCL